MAKLKQATSRIRFENECKRAANKTGYEVNFYSAPVGEKSINEDDGSLHISKFGVRACFWIQSDDPKIQNERAREVLKALRLAVPDSALTEEYAEEDECDCPGRA